METYEFFHSPSMPFFAVDSYLLPPEESHTSVPLPFLVENHGLHPQFALSSPSLEMQEAMEHLTSNLHTNLSGSNASLECTDVLKADPYLEYLSEILMAEEHEDSPLAQEDTLASYNAMMRSFYDIIGEPWPLNQASSQHCASAFEGSRPSDTRLPVMELSGGCNNQQEEGMSEELFMTDSSIDSLDILFKDLNVEADYASLYVGKDQSLPSVSSQNADKASCRTDVKRKPSRNGRKKGGQHVQKGRSAEAVFVDLTELLVTCAQAVAVGDAQNAYQIMHKLQYLYGVSPRGNSLQRIAQYFCDALVARMRGMGSHLYQKSLENMPTVASVLKAGKIWYEMHPLLKVTHYFANQSILKVAEGASRLHVVDFGIMHGMQWPCLINALADQAGGPPLLVITGIEHPKFGKNCLERLQECGRRLAAYANRCNVPFQFRPLLAEEWENIDPADLQLQQGEILVVNSVKRLSLLADESVDSSKAISPRQKLLMFLRSLNPHLFFIADMNLACSSLSFVSRFQEAVKYFYSKQDMHDTVCIDDPDRLFVEQSFHIRQILNIVACEGTERITRPEMFKQWDLRIRRAGFDLLPMPPHFLSRAKLFVQKHYHKNFFVHDDAKGWMLLGWKGRALHAISAWKPSHMV